MELKDYQLTVLRDLDAYLDVLLERGGHLSESFKTYWQERGVLNQNYKNNVQGVPHVCVKVPTAGGKTYIAVNALDNIFGAFAQYNPIRPKFVVWLVPSLTILEQTVKHLSDVDHPYRQRLNVLFNGRVQVYEKADVLQGAGFNADSVREQLSIVVMTFDSLKGRSKEVLKAYQDNGYLASFLNASNDEAALLPEYDKTALINVIRSLKPVVVVDESHNAESALSVDMLQTLNPSFILDLTATPRNNSNIISYIDAMQLKRQHMVKLPVIVARQQSQEDVIMAALKMRFQLEEYAKKAEAQGGDYIRPIVLFQAEPKNKEDTQTFDKVKQSLIDLGVNKDEIAIKTANINELKGIDLMSRDCPIRYIITINALKEGWDCPFAYVLASLQNMNSAVDVEQILGRVLRMPYAQTRPVDSLNKAYAHVIAESTAQAASMLKDRMVNNMGFNRWEADMALANNIQGQLEVTQDQSTTPALPVIPEMVVALNHVPDTSYFSDEVKAAIKILPTNNGKSATVLIQKGVSEDTFKQVEQSIISSAPAKAQEHAQEAFNEARAERQAASAPENWNAQFALIPQLCLFWDNEWQVVEKEVIENAVEVDLLKYPLELAFTIREVANSYEIDMNVDGNAVTYRHLAVEQLHFNEMQSELTEHDLVTWLDKQVRQQGITQTHMRAYLLKLVNYLIHERKISLTALLRSQFQLAQAVREQINLILVKTREEAFQTDLFGQMSIAPEPAAWNQFEFKAGRYPVRTAYRGSFEFKKHFYAQIDDLREKRKDGQDTEEFICARLIDTHENVKHWVRNIPQQREASFHLPTAKNEFYPDFVCELLDGTLAVIEYKGGHLVTNDESRDKDDVGNQWAKSSDGQCRFIMVRPQKEDAQHRTIEQQINDILA